MPSEFNDAIIAHQAAFGLELGEAVVGRLNDYYEFVQVHNPLLHLVGPCSASEFAVRHILESLTVLEHLPRGAIFADVGTGAGLPGIPCLVARDDLRAILIESKERKAAFLNGACTKLGLNGRATVVNRQFSETDPGGSQYLTCRALDKFTERLPRLMKWSAPRTMLLFGGDGLADALQAAGAQFVQKQMPMSDKRYLFVTGAEYGS